MIEPVTWDGGVTLFRAPDAGRRSLKITLTPGPQGARQDFKLPEDVNSLEVPGYAAKVDCEVTVTPASLPARLRMGRQKIALRTEPRPFRVLVSGSGRCGTQTLAHWLDGMTFGDGTPVDARHESLAAHVLPCLIEGDTETIAKVVTGQGHNIESSPFYALAADQLKAGRIVQLVRDGRRVVQSGVNRGWYANDALWNRIKPRFTDDVFTNSCHFWRHSNAELEKVADLRIRLEDLSTDAAAQAQFLADLGIAAIDRPFPHANKGKSSSAASSWTDDQRQVFTEICGELMDRYYPGWQEDW